MTKKRPTIAALKEAAKGKISPLREESMSITIGNYVFDGPFLNVESLKDWPGVYAILCCSTYSWEVIDIGESFNVKTRVSSHDRKDCWEHHCGNTIKYAVYYTSPIDQAGRKIIEQELRRRYNPVCGDR